MPRPISSLKTLRRLLRDAVRSSGPDCDTAKALRQAIKANAAARRRRSIKSAPCQAPAEVPPAIQAADARATTRRLPGRKGGDAA